MLDREFETQSVDPMFLEPESGLAWYDRKRGSLELVLGVQSPYEAAESIAHLLGNARAPFKPARINTQFTYVGGGFGGRDHTPFVLYVALAAMFFPGRPVRLAHDRYQQFQAGIKRHAFKMRSRIGVDRATGKIQAFAADHVLDGGGLANFSANVATVGATAAIGIYDIPKVDVTTVALHSRGVTAGSMRGYGTLQTMTALEVLIDEVAAALPLDPIEFRRRNALKPRGRTMTGNPYSVSVRTPEILDKLEKHPIWQQRAQEKARAPQAGSLVGTGVACVTKDYGTGADCSLGRVELSTGGHGSRSIATMSRWATASARRLPTAWRCIWAASPTKSRWRGSTAMTCSGWSPQAIPTRWTRRRRTPRRKIRAGCRRSARRPAPRSARMSARMRRPRPRASSSASACGRRRSSCGASRRPTRAQRIGPRRAGRTDNWSMPGLAPLSLPAFAAKAHARNLVTGAMAHAFSRWAWSRARFPIVGETVSRRDRCAGVRKGSGKFERLDRVSVKFPPTDNNRIGTVFTSMCGTLVRVEIERATGALRIAKAYSVFECGQALVPEVVLGQAQGGFAMGVGYALARDAAALRRRPRQRAVESRTISRRARIGPAAARPRNRDAAAADAGRAAEGHGGSRDDSGGARAPERHFRRHRPPLPVPAGDPSHAQGSARVTTSSITINGRAHGPTDVRDDLSMNDFLREYLGMTGTKFGCGAAQCLSCAVIVDNPDGTSYTSPTCVVSAASFDGKAIRTVEGHAKNGELSALQKAFIEHFAFQCGYCTAAS